MLKIDRYIRKIKAIRPTVKAGKSSSPRHFQLRARFALIALVAVLAVFATGIALRDTAMVRTSEAMAEPLEITNLSIPSYSVVDFGSGINAYIDRAYLIDSVPASFIGDIKYIKTANDHKTSTANPFLSFDVNQDVTVMVAYDDRLTPPTWMNGFVDMGENISIGGGAHSLYRKDFPQGTVSLGANEGVDSSSMYGVLVSPQGAFGDPPTGLLPHEWPAKVHLSVGESYTYTLRDRSTRTLRLLSYDRVIPRHLITANVEVSGNGKTETHTLNVAFAGLPVSINGLRVYAYAWKEAGDYGYEGDGVSTFPLLDGKDIGFALSDANHTMFPNIDDYTYPVDIVPFEGHDIYQTFLESKGGPTSEAHSGFDIRHPQQNNLVAMTDGWVFTSGPWPGSTTGEGALQLAPDGPGQWSEDRFWRWTHFNVGSLTVPNGSFVEKGTVLGKKCSGCPHYHMGSRNQFDFGTWLFTSEIWNNEHKEDFPTPRRWLILGPYSGDMEDAFLTSNENGDISSGILPSEGAFDKDGNMQWKMRDNFAAGVTHMGELTSDSPWGGYMDQNPARPGMPRDMVGYAAAYVYSPEDHTSDNEVFLKFGASYGASIWLNGQSVFDNTDNLANHRYYTHNTFNEPALLIDDADIPLPLKKGWNTLIVKTNIGSISSWRFSSKIGDSNGMRIPGLIFSTRNIDLEVTSTTNNSVSVAWNDPGFHGTFVDTYKVDVALDASFANPVISDLDVGSVTGYTINGLNEGQNYFIRVKPFNYSEMGGSAYWHHFDMTSAQTSGASGSSVEFSIIAPVEGQPIVNDGFTVAYSSSGDVQIASEAVLKLDNGLEVGGLPVNGTRDFSGVPAGSHTLQGWLEDSIGNVIAGTLFSISFTTEDAPASVTGRIVADPRVNGWLRVQGNRIVDENNNGVMLRGANLTNWQWIWDSVPDKSQAIEFQRRAIPVLAGSPPDGWGANAIHLDLSAVPFIEGDQEYIDAVDELVALSKAHGAYSVVSLRFEDIINEPTRPTEIIAQGGAVIAEHFKDEPAVILVAGSEPRNVSWQELRPLLEDIIDAIRSSNPRAMVGAPGLQWSRYVYDNLTDPVRRDNIFMHVSTFDKWDIVLNGGSGFNSYRLDEVTAAYPVMFGGFGLFVNPPGGNFWMTDFNDLVRLYDYAESHNIHWTAWVFDTNACPCLINNSNTFEPTQFGEETRSRLQAAATGEPPAAPKVLVFHETASFVHSSTNDGVAAVHQLGVENGFDVDDTNDSSAFTDANLAQYDAIVFLNTHQDVLTSAEEGAFQRYIQAGGGFAGIHIASGTEQSWLWYQQLVGAKFNFHPDIQSANVIIEDPNHPSTASLPPVWTLSDEWYNFTSQPDRSKLRILATLDESTYSGGTHGSDHPIAWCQEFDGGRSWYTAMGHLDSHYYDSLFLSHILGGIQYAAGIVEADCSPQTQSESGMISNLSVASGSSYPIFENALNNGEKAYTDRLFEFLNVPESLIGATYIRTANDHKVETANPFLSFDVDRSITVYVAYDDRFAPPAWMSDFVDTGENVNIGTVTSSGSHSIFSRDFQSGRVELGANEGSSSSSMYAVFIVEIEQPNTPPTASFSANPDSGEAPLTVSFDASASSDSDGSIVSYAWDFGDGSTGSGALTSHEFVNPGSYNVVLTVTDDDGESDTAQTSITVTEPAPIELEITNVSAASGANYQVGDAIGAGQTVYVDRSFTYSSVPASIDGEKYILTGNNDKTRTDAGFLSFDVNHDVEVFVIYDDRLSTPAWMNGFVDTGDDVFVGSGLYNVFERSFDAGQVVLGGNHGVSSSSMYAVAVKPVPQDPNAPPQAGFTYNPNSGIAPLSVDFDASGSDDPDGSIVSYAWDFGDGSTGSGEAVSHLFADAGSYSVELTVTDDDGDSDTMQATVTVNEPLLLSAGSAEVNATESVAVPVVLSEAPNGLAGYIITASLDSSDAEFVGVTFPNFMVTNFELLSPSQVEFRASDIDGLVADGDSDVLLANLIVQGVAEGAAGVDLAVTMLHDRPGDTIEIDEMVSGLVTVHPAPLPTLPGMAGVVQDLDGDGLYEDTNGNGVLDFADLTALYMNLGSAEVQDNAALFDFSGDGLVNDDDVIVLLDMIIAAMSS